MTIPAAAYYRMSDDSQQSSIARQRSQVVPLAARDGFEIVREYIDEAVAGDEIARRPNFRRMLADATAGHFEVIICDDMDRFGRFDALVYGEVAAPLRRAGVRLVSAAQGVVDWDDMLSTLNDVMRMAFKREQSRDTARRVLTQQLVRAKRGEWCSVPPYGFTIGPDKRLLSVEAEARVVRWLFEQYARGEASLGWLAGELSARGVETPGRRSRHWAATMVQRILKNPAYVGDVHYARRPHGKSYRAAEGGGTRKATSPGWDRNADFICVPDAHPAIVERDTFERVQLILRQRTVRTTPSKGGGCFALSSLVICGECGCRMTGRTCGRTGRIQYLCSTYNTSSGRSCHRNVINEWPLLRTILRRITDDFASLESMESIREELRRHAAAGTDRATQLRAKVAALEAQVETGAKRLLVIDPEFIPDAQNALRNLRAEKTEAERELSALAREPSSEDVLRHVESMLWRIREVKNATQPAEVRELIRSVVDRVVVNFERTNPGGQRYWTRPTGGVIYVSGFTPESPPPGCPERWRTAG